MNNKQQEQQHYDKVERNMLAKDILLVLVSETQKRTGSVNASHVVDDAYEIANEFIKKAKGNIK